MRRLPSCFLVLAVLAFGLPFGSVATAETPVAAARETEPVVLTGERFPEWATIADVTAEAPHNEGKQCLINEGGAGDNPLTPDESCSHNQYEDPDFQSSDFLQNEGVAIDRLLGYQWNGEDFEQIPFQVDEMFVRYLSNNKSGFAFHSETDQHTSYAFEREGFRWTDDFGDERPDDPLAPCTAQPDSEVAKDPVPGLDTDDELVFMYDDAGGRAEAAALLPPGVQDSYEVTLVDPTDPENVKYAYVMLAGPDGPGAAFDETNGYVRYQRDDPEDRNLFLFSESSYDNYGAAPTGPVAERDPATGEWICRTDKNVQRRPSDKATINTPRYQFRYEGRWLMTELRVSADDVGDWTYGDDIVDQWKARAFQQRPSGQTPCCGYEEEVNNWGGSSIMMGELAGPVRVLRETWGADSATNIARREIFYRDEIRLGSFLRVHVIPPLDGIYAQWDYNAGKVQKYFNPFQSGGVPIDGQNDEVFGNSRIHVGRDGVSYDGDDDVSDQLDEATGSDTQSVGNPNEPDCEYPGQPLEEQYDTWRQQIPQPIRGELPGDIVDLCIYNDVDSPDPTFSGVVAGLNWEQIAGDQGTLVLRNAIKQFTPGGTVQGLIAVPYYRDDSCFDDGTGSNPGPHLNGRNADTGPHANHDGVPRECWTPEDGTPPVTGDPRFWQGSIGTHGVHILLIAESDNGMTTVPLTEIDTEQRIVVLKPTLENVGESYGRAPEKPIVVGAAPESRVTQPAEPEPSETQLTITGDASGKITDQATLAARLTSEGTGVAGKEIQFSLDGTEVGRAETDGNGDASVSFDVTGPARTAEQGAAFAGDASHAASAATAAFEVQRDDSVLEIVGDSGGQISDPATLAARLTDESGPLAGREVVFTLDSEEVGRATTDEDGRASVDMTVSGPAGERAQGATFAGDDTFASSAATAPFTVERDDTTLSVTTTAKGVNITATAKLTDADSGAGLAGRTILFFVNGNQVASGVTNSSGVATAKFKVKKGQPVSARFEGDDSYKGSNAQAS